MCTPCSGSPIEIGECGADETGATQNRAGTSPRNYHGAAKKPTAKGEVGGRREENQGAERGSGKGPRDPSKRPPWKRCARAAGRPSGDEPEQAPQALAARRLPQGTAVAGRGRPCRAGGAAPAPSRRGPADRARPKSRDRPAFHRKKNQRTRRLRNQNGQTERIDLRARAGHQAGPRPSLDKMVPS